MLDLKSTGHIVRRDECEVGESKATLELMRTSWKVREQAGLHVNLSQPLNVWFQRWESPAGEGGVLPYGAQHTPGP